MHAPKFLVTVPRELVIYLVYYTIILLPLFRPEEGATHRNIATCFGKLLGLLQSFEFFEINILESHILTHSDIHEASRQHNTKKPLR